MELRAAIWQQTQEPHTVVDFTNLGLDPRSPLAGQQAHTSRLTPAKSLTIGGLISSFMVATNKNNYHSGRATFDTGMHMVGMATLISNPLMHSYAAGLTITHVDYILLLQSNIVNKYHSRR